MVAGHRPATDSASQKQLFKKLRISALFFTGTLLSFFTAAAAFAVNDFFAAFFTWSASARLTHLTPFFLCLLQNSLNIL